MHRRAVPSSFSSAFTRSMGLGGVWCTPATSLKPVLRSPCGSNHLAVGWRRQYSQGVAASRALGAKSFSELRSAAVSIKRRYIRVATYLALGFVVVVFPVTTLAAQAWEQRHWPTLQAKVVEVTPLEGTKKRRVTYRYKVLGRVIEKTQVNWNVPWWDRVNNTVLDFKEDDFVLIHHHPNNVMLSVLKPGNFAHPNFGRLQGEVIEDTTKPVRRMPTKIGPQ